MRTISILLLAFILAGCTTAGRKMHRLAPGMEKHQVVKVIGWPQSTARQGNVEVLHYKGGVTRAEYHFVRLVNGQVESFGSETKNQKVTPSEPPLNPAAR